MFAARFGAFRKQAITSLISGFFNSVTSVARLHPKARPGVHGVEVLTDIAYRSADAPGSQDHLLDVYRPAGTHGVLRPVVLYVHGGGFSILSKDTHWIMGLQFARMGYVVFNINYRLAPAHRYPAALDDSAAAFEWVVRNAERFGGDISTLVLAGESAGANLVTGLALSCSYDLPEAASRRVKACGVQPVAVIAACGMMQVSDVQRFARKAPVSSFVMGRMEKISSSYLPVNRDSELGLADPLVVLEHAPEPLRSLPPFFLPCGCKDPVLDDTLRMGAALEKLGVDARVKLYPGEPHAFHAFVFRKQARECWNDIFAFLDGTLGAKKATPAQVREQQ